MALSFREDVRLQDSKALCITEYLMPVVLGTAGCTPPDIHTLDKRLPAGVLKIVGQKELGCVQLPKPTTTKKHCGNIRARHGIRNIFPCFCILLAMLCYPNILVAGPLNELLHKGKQTVDIGEEWFRKLFVGEPPVASPALMNGIRDIAEECSSQLDSGTGKNEKSLVDKLLVRDAKYQRLVERALTLLSQSEARDFMLRHIEARRAARSLSNKVSILEREMLVAPLTVPAWRIWEDSREDVRNKLDSAKAKLLRAKNDIVRAADGLRECLDRHRVPLSSDQIESLLLCADGQDILAIISISENLAALNKALENSILKDQGSEQALKNYAACHMVMQEAFHMAYRQALDNIRTIYLVRIDEISRQAMALCTDAQEMLPTVSNPQQKTLLANIEGNKAVIQAAGNYRNYLEKQAAFLEQMRLELEQCIRVSENTYATVTNSGALLELIETAGKSLNRVVALKTPEFAVLHDNVMRERFENITLQIQAYKGM